MTAEYDLEVLASMGIEQAQERLERDGGFPPFALGIEATEPEDTPDVSVLELDDDVPDEDMLPALLAGIGEQRDDWRGVAFVFDSELDDGQSALGLLLQHSAGLGLDLYLPYTETDDEISYGEAVQQEPSLAIWDE